MGAAELISRNSINTETLPFIWTPGRHVQYVVFTEIAITAIRMAKKEGADALIEHASRNSKAKYILGQRDMKVLAIEAFREFIEDYCSESGRKDLSVDSTHYLEMFKSKLEDKK